MKEGYSVTVSKWGEPILTIEPNCLSGSDLTGDDVLAVNDLGQHLVAFAGVQSERYVGGIRFDPPNENGHKSSCDCPDCVPF